MTRITVSDIKNRKGKTPLVCLTAYTAPMAEILDPHCDILLVGDSLGMALYGMDNTLAVDLEMMIRHGRAVMRRAQNACVIVDMPGGTYENAPQKALENAQLLMAETGCDGVKLEGGAAMAETISHLTENGVPVMGHIGLLPQSVVKDGGYKIKGKTPEEAARLIEDAKVVADAGAFALVIEGTIERAAAQITGVVDIPTIGIGASAECDGQILVTEDMLGYFEKTPRFVKIYADLRSVIDQAVSEYKAEVQDRRFPAADHTYRET